MRLWEPCSWGYELWVIFSSLWKQDIVQGHVYKKCWRNPESYRYIKGTSSCLIFEPTCANAHWALCLSVPGPKVSQNNSLEKNSYLEYGPCIIHTVWYICKQLLAIYQIQMMVYGTGRWAHFNVKLHFYLPWILSGHRRPVGQFSTLIRKKVAFLGRPIGCALWLMPCYGVHRIP